MGCEKGLVGCGVLQLGGGEVDACRWGLEDVQTVFVDLINGGGVWVDCQTEEKKRGTQNEGRGREGVKRKSGQIQPLQS